MNQTPALGKNKSEMTPASRTDRAGLIEMQKSGGRRASVSGSSRFCEAELAARDDDGAAAHLDAVDAVPGSLRARV